MIKNRWMLILLYIFTVGIIFYTDIDTYNIITLYSGFIFGLIYVIFYMIYISVNKKYDNWIKDKIDMYVNITIILYTIISFISAIIIDKSLIAYTIFTTTPPLIFIILVSSFNREKMNISAIKKIVLYIMVFSSIIALFMYIFGYSQVKLSSNPIIKFTTKQEYLNAFNEGRLSWICTHKSRFATFCILGLGLLISEKSISFKKKFLYSFIFIVDIFLSNSMTGIMASFIVIIFSLKNYIKRLSLYLKIPIFFLLSALFLGGITYYFYVIQNVRDLSTGGSRFIIWQAGIDIIKDNIFGIVHFTTEKNVIADNAIYSNLHNIFLNEIAQKGILPGFLYVLIFVLLIIKFYRYKENIYMSVILAVILIGFIDANLSDEMLYMFWYIEAFLYAQCNLSLSKENNIYDKDK